MANINQYTQENMPVAVNQGRPAQADDFGGNQTGLMAQAKAGSDMASALGQVGEQIGAIETKRRNRLDTINIARTADSFYNDAFGEYNRTMSEDDIIDPSTTDKFNENIRGKAAAVLSTFQGSPEAKARLELEIMNQASTFTRQMTETGLGAQRKFIVGKAGEKINALVAQIQENPASFNEIMLQSDKVVDEYAGGLYAEDEKALRKAGREQIAITTLNSYTDRGMYDEANALIDSNPAILEFINPTEQRNVLSRINQGINERKKVFEDAKKKKDLLEWGEGITGQKVDSMAALNFIMGSDIKRPNDDVLSEIAAIYKMKPEDLPPEVTLKVKYPDLKLFDSDVDPNKDFGPGNKITVSGIKKSVSPIVLNAETIRTQRTMLNIAIEQAKNGNKAAGQAAVTAFKKMLDPTSAVMEGEIAMLGQAEGLSGRIDKMFDPGKPVSSDQLDELKAFGEKFTDDLLKSKKTKLDNYLIDSDSRGFRRVDIGLPTEVYKDIFGTETVGEIKPDAPAPAGLNEMSEDDLQRMLDEMEKAGK
jgi:hypothetical protein